MSSLSPCTILRPLFTCVSDGNPLRRLLMRSKGGLVGVVSELHEMPPLTDSLRITLQVPGAQKALGIPRPAKSVETSLDAADTSPASVRGRIEQSMTPQVWGLP